VLALSKIVSKYRFITDVEAGKDHMQIGLIAQEVQAISPGLVKEGADGYFGLEYSVLYMKGFKALGETMERVLTIEAYIAANDNHESRIAALEAEIAALKAAA
jgi:hypothetical protein